MKLDKKYFFSIIELLVVIAVLGALTALVLPGLSSTAKYAEDTVCDKEMAGIKKAFSRLYSDCVIDDTRLNDAALYGVWGLFSLTHPDEGDDFERYNYDRGKGWRGPYAESEGTININPFVAGQSSGSVSVPIFKDPYGGYYRVMIPQGEKPIKIALICTGKNLTLDTGVTDKDINGNLIAKDDDKVLPLIICK
jgi:hypothetical protein